MDRRERTALILVDVINSFFEPGQPNHYEGVEAVVAPLRALLQAARASGTIVVHAAEKHRPAFHDFEWKKLPVHHLEDAHDAAFFGERRRVVARTSAGQEIDVRPPSDMANDHEATAQQSGQVFFDPAAAFLFPALQTT